jgi:hypothetical protein
MHNVIAMKKSIKTYRFRHVFTNTKSSDFGLKITMYNALWDL